MEHYQYRRNTIAWLKKWVGGDIMMNIEYGRKWVGE
jgi:hypothetical protein